MANAKNLSFPKLILVYFAIGICALGMFGGVTYWATSLASTANQSLAISQSNATAGERHTQTLNRVDNLLKDDQVLLQFVYGIQKGTPDTRAELIYFGAQLNNICASTPGCKVVPIPPALMNATTTTTVPQ